MGKRPQTSAAGGPNRAARDASGQPPASPEGVTRDNLGQAFHGPAPAARDASGHPPSGPDSDTASAPAGLPGRAGPLPGSHLLADLLAPGLRIVFCGTALGRVSAEQRAYYANPTNLFWRALAETGLTPGRYAPQDWPKLLTLGIGLTDLSKAHYGNDDELPPEAFDVAALIAKIETHRPRFLAFTSKTAASALLGLPTGRLQLGLQQAQIGQTQLWVLPSPSGQARRFWTLQPWHDLAAAARLPAP